MDLNETVCKGVNWIKLAEDSTTVDLCEQSNEPPGLPKALHFLTTVYCSWNN